VNTTLETVVRRDRAIVGAGLAGLAILAWLYVLGLAQAMSDLDMHAAMGMAGPQMHGWHLADGLLTFLMWSVMMAAMMIPAASPMVLMFARIARSRPAAGRPFAQTGVFVLGYLLLWATYSALATLAQWGLHSASLLSPMLMTTSHHLGGALLIAAGIFQWTPLKDRCLRACRSPLAFIMSEWREGSAGALIMGLRHGAYCVGCCWVLMALLFVAGVMNLVWVAALAAFVLIEKMAPGEQWVTRIAGVVLVVAGTLLMTPLWR